MKTAATVGVVLGVLVGVFGLIFTLVGWVGDPDKGLWFILGAVLIQIGTMIWGLRKTAAEGRRYGGQLVAGIVISLVGGLLILVIAMINLGLLAPPDVFDAAKAQLEDNLAAQGLSEAQIQTWVENTAFTRTAWFAGVQGCFGTLVTGFVLSLILAAVFRSRD